MCPPGPYTVLPGRHLVCCDESIIDGDGVLVESDVEFNGSFGG